MIKKALLILLAFTTISIASEKDIKEAVYSIDFDAAVLDLCISDIKACEILTDKTIYKYLKKYYIPALISIAKIESQFKYKQGKYDKNDIGYFQINKKIWTKEKLRKYNILYSYHSIKHNPRVAAEVALKIWLINVTRYISTYKKYPKDLSEYISLYHRVDSINRNYKKKIKRVMYKYIAENKRKEV